MIKHDKFLGNRYNIIHKLGEGGMGAVWLAEDTLLDFRTVAIKTLPLDILNNSIAFERLKKGFFAEFNGWGVKNG